MKTDQVIQWCDENSLRSYPIDEGATQSDDTGRQLPTDILVDLSLTVPLSQTNIRVGAVRITGQLLSLMICSDQGGLMVGTFWRSATQPYRAYPLTSVVPNCNGWVTFGNHLALGTEDYRFGTAPQSLICPHAIHYVAQPAVQDLVLSQNPDSGAATGYVRLLAGAGVRWARNPSDQQNILLSIDPAIAGLLGGPESQQASTQLCGVPPITRLNGVVPDSSGKIKLVFR